MSVSNNTELKSEKPEILRLLVFSVSLRIESLNTRLAKLAATVGEKNGAVVDFANMEEFDCPSFNGNDEEKSGIPSGAAEFRKRILANDAFIIACPEYNGSMPGLIKNSIDWTSRFRPQPFNEKTWFAYVCITLDGRGKQSPLVASGTF